MKLTHLLAAVMCAAPTLMPAQVTPARGDQLVSETIELMKTNVAKITEPTEKDRWSANLELWQLKSRVVGVPSQAALDRMNGIVDRIFTNVARITDRAEKGRWQANLDMWRILSACPDKMPQADQATLKAIFARMDDNVATIIAPMEQERWTANRDLWRAQLAKLNTPK